MKTTKNILALLLALSICPGLRSQILDVEEMFQEMDQWCWAGTSACFLDYYGCTRPQCEIVDYTRTVSPSGDFGYVNVCMDRSAANHGKYISNAPGTIADILAHFADIVLVVGEGALDYNRISEEFSARRPFVIRWAWDGGGAHYVLGHGLAGQDVYYMNPWPGEGKKIGTYDWMKTGSGHTWSLTGFTLTNPKTAKPAKPSGDALLYEDSGNSYYSTSGVKYASSYDWNLLPAEAGTVSHTDTLATIDWSPTFSGTAQLTVNGRNRSGSGIVSDALEIMVLPSGTDPTLSDLSVNNETVDGFASNVFDYFIDMTSSNIPAIDAVPKNPNAMVVITPPSSIPGKAVIEVSSADHLTNCIYTIHFENKTGEYWSWASSAGGRNYCKANALTIDNQGNIWSAGSFNSFSISIGSSTLYHTGGGDVFIVRYLPNGTVDWALSSGEPGFASASDMTSDPYGNIYVIGDFQGEYISFGNDTLQNNGPVGSSDIFIVKIDPSGKVTWLKSIGSGFIEKGNSIVSDHNGHVYATGWFTARTLNLGTHILTGTGGADIFLCKISSSGDFEWAFNPIGDGDDFGNDITVDMQGNIVISGIFTGSSISFGSTVLNNDGIANVVLAKFDPSGTVTWAKCATGDGEDCSHGICADNNGNIYVTGEFSSSQLNFGTLRIDNSGDTGVFLAKYSSAGDPVWVSGTEGSGMASSTGVILDANDNVCITGVYDSSLFRFDEKSLPNMGKNDIFITKYDPQGSVIWTKWAGGCSDDESSDITSDPAGNIYLTGMFTSPAIAFGSTMVENIGMGSMFIAKLTGFSLSIDQESNVSSFAIYPNPSSGEITVICPDDTYELRIFDNKASLVRLIRAEGKTLHRLILTGEGLYFVQARSAKEVSTIKLIVIPAR